MKQTLIVGVDISKATLDFFVKPADLAVNTANNKAGFTSLLARIKPLLGDDIRLLVVMEHTGKYSLKLETFLRSKSVDYCKVPALEIKRSVGMTRGKNDQVDAKRIAEYAWLRRDVLQAEAAVTKEIMELKELVALRFHLIKIRTGYKCRFKELKSSGSCTASDFIGKTHLSLIKDLDGRMGKLDEKIKALIASRVELQNTYKLLESIKGVGPVVAVFMISCTANFTRFNNARKFNCYAGLAPFANTSGTSLKGKGRISHLANKPAKHMLSMAATSAIQHDQELKAYYNKRKAEGKSKSNCINVIRAKLVARMFAVIKRQTPYTPIKQAA